MRTAREILNEYKWRRDRDNSLVEVHFIHRGAPNDTRVILADQIQRLDQLFFHTSEDSIPYHRIFKISYRGKSVFQRPHNDPGSKTGHSEGPST